jgi:hypothetical protein
VPFLPVAAIALLGLMLGPATGGFFPGVAAGAVLLLVLFYALVAYTEELMFRGCCCTAWPPPAPRRAFTRRGRPPARPPAAGWVILPLSLVGGAATVGHKAPTTSPGRRAGR